jgi:hypothetical protein
VTDNCPHCRGYAVEADRLTKLVSALTTENHEIILEKNALKGQITRLENSAPVVEDIGFLLDLWLELCATPRQRKIAAINVEGPRGKIARAALKTMTSGKREVRRERCADAIRGKCLRPYWSFGQWFASDGPKRIWKNDVEHALGSERLLEEHAGYWEFVQSKPLEWRERAWQAASLVEAHYQSLYFDLWLSPENVASREGLVEPGLSVLPGTFVEIPQVPEKRPRLFVVPNPESEEAA